MKVVVYLLFFFLSTTYVQAEKDKQHTIFPKYVESDKIRIIVRTYDDDPKNWLKMYQNSKEKDIPIDVEFDVDDVMLVYIMDVNAEKLRCGHYYPKKILYLYFKKPTNSRGINTPINKPCFYQRSATMKLHVITKKKEYLSRTQTFAIHPSSRAH